MKRIIVKVFGLFYQRWKYIQNNLHYGKKGKKFKTPKTPNSIEVKIKSAFVKFFIALICRKAVMQSSKIKPEVIIVIISRCFFMVTILPEKFSKFAICKAINIYYHNYDNISTIN